PFGVPRSGASRERARTSTRYGVPPSEMAKCTRLAYRSRVATLRHWMPNWFALMRRSPPVRLWCEHNMGWGQKPRYQSRAGELVRYTYRTPKGFGRTIYDHGGL